jgi:hypothetical protein
MSGASSETIQYFQGCGPPLCLNTKNDATDWDNLTNEVCGHSKVRHEFNRVISIALKSLDYVFHSFRATSTVH